MRSNPKLWQAADVLPESLRACDTPETIRWGIPVGSGRSYGATIVGAVGREGLFSQNDDFRFDPETQSLEVGAAYTLRAIEARLIPFGYELPVIPGSSLITLGGAIASDVHGKNHVWRGNFGNWVTEILLVRSDLAIAQWVSSTHLESLFRATVGGMGATGLILKARMRCVPLGPRFFAVHPKEVRSADELVDLATRTGADSHFNSILKLRRGSQGVVGKVLRYSPSKWSPRIRPRFFPKSPTSLHRHVASALSVLNPSWLFDLSQALGGVASVGVINRENALCPLDSIANWNQVIGLNKLFQSSMLIPFQMAASFLREVQRWTSDTGHQPFLITAKVLGDVAPQGFLSLSGPGICFCFDFKHRGPGVQELFSGIERIVVSCGGRISLSKNRFFSAEMAKKMYPNWIHWAQLQEPLFQSELIARFREA